jgi:hypothetical protein
MCTLKLRPLTWRSSEVGCQVWTLEALKGTTTKVILNLKLFTIKGKISLNPRPNKLSFNNVNAFPKFNKFDNFYDPQNLISGNELNQSVSF